MTDNPYKIKVSVTKYRQKYFAVAIRQNKVIKSSLGRRRKFDALNDVSCLEKLYISPLYKRIAENLGKAYYGHEIHFNFKKPSIKSFKGKVLDKVLKIPPGEVRTYKEIAQSLGSNSYRAVGNALNHNPLPIIIPCHRVVRWDLSIGGYKGGAEMKKELLANEGVVLIKNRVLRK